MIKFSTIPRWLALPLMVAGLVNLLGMAECSKVDNSVTAPGEESFGAPSRNPCIEACNLTAKESLLAENELFETNLFACNGDPECINAERHRHEMALFQIRMDFRECREACHDQGGGSGGE
jgi:hypothetical protein